MTSTRSIRGLLGLVLLLVPMVLEADTQVPPGTISADTTWEAQYSPYIVTGEVNVAGSPAPKLTIKPGVTVKFGSGASLLIGSGSAGTLEAVGTAAAPIVFTTDVSPAAAGSWYLWFRGAGSVASRLAYATIEYGGRGGNYGWGGAHVGTPVEFDNVTLRNNLIAGVTVDGSGASPTLTACTITGNSGYGIDVKSGSLTVNNTSITSNTEYAIRVTPVIQLIGLTGLSFAANGPGKDAIQILGGTIAADRTWLATPYPYVVSDEINVAGSPAPKLTIKPGVTVKFASGKGLLIGSGSAGTLEAVGTATAPIVFTTDVSSPVAGSWYLHFRGAGSVVSRLGYATIEYGGRSGANYGWGGAHVSTPVEFDNVTFRNNLIAGVTVDGSGANPSLSACTITGNTGYGIDVKSGSLAVSNTSITSNSEYAIRVTPVIQINFLTGLYFAANGPGKDAIQVLGGTIQENRTWLATPYPYVISDEIHVAGSPAPTLWINPGVTVKFGSGKGLVIGPGTLKAIGTAAAPIVFTTNALPADAVAGSWYLRFTGTGSVASRLEYATIEYGGRGGSYGWGGAHVSTPVEFDNVTFRNNLIAGVTVDGAGASPTLTACTITGNTGYGIDVKSGALTVNNTSITSNSEYAIRVTPVIQLSGLTGLSFATNGPGKDAIQILGGTIQEDRTWLATPYPYVVSDEIQVAGSPAPTLTIKPGVTVRFGSGKGLLIGPGMLEAVGTAAAPIVFTTNVSPAAAGSWYLRFTSAGNVQSRLEYATIEYGGRGSNYGWGGAHVAASSPTFEHVTFRNNLIAGITADGGAPKVIHCSFVANASGVKTQGGAAVDARLSHWDAANGPSGSGAGSGQSITSGVSFDPWITSTPTNPHFFDSVTILNRTFNAEIATVARIRFTTTLSGIWTASIVNSQDTTLRNFSGSGSSGEIVWDGKNTFGAIQGDGQYTYTIESMTPANLTDALGSLTPSYSVAPVRGFLIIDSSKQIVISNVAVSPSPFSPNADGVKDTTAVSGQLNYEDLPWTVDVKNSAGTVVRTATGSGQFIYYVWDGNNATGQTQTDGIYTLALTATAGTTSETVSTTVILDNTPPVATISSPGAGQVLSNVYQNGSGDVPVRGSISDTHLVSWTLVDLRTQEEPPQTFMNLVGTGTTPVSETTIAVWNTLARVNGSYSLRLTVADAAGNQTTTTHTLTIGNFTMAQFNEVNASPWQLNALAGGTIKYRSVVPFTLTETLIIKNSAGQIVRTLVSAVQRSNGIFEDVWNGSSDAGAALPDGPYFYYATVTSGASSMTWDLSQQMRGEPATPHRPVEPSSFDPFNNVPREFAYTLLQPMRVNVAVSERNHQIVTNCTDEGVVCLEEGVYKPFGSHSYSWAGTSPSGSFLWNHQWALVVSLDFPQNAVVLYGRMPKLSTPSITPPMFNPAFGTQSVSFNLVTSPPGATADIEIRFINHGSESTLRTVSVAAQQTGVISVVWDGKADNGMWVAPGGYTAIITATDAIGNKAVLHAVTTVRY